MDVNMVWIFNKTPHIFVDAFTYSPSVYEYTPLVRASQAVPEYWKKLDNPDPITGVDGNGGYFVRRHSTIKNCKGMIELYKRGFIIENWSDISLMIEDQGYKFYYADLESPKSHPKEQFGEGFKNFHHLKLMSPWLVKEKTGVKFHCSPTLWSHENYDFIMPPGILDFKSNHAINLQIMLRKRPTPYEITIEFGQPMAHFIPISDKKIKLKNHLVDQMEFNKLKIHPANTFWGWRKIDKLIKRNDERESKCPFGFK
jgi:hypothetical protein